jgi:hypothetical protein
MANVVIDILAEFTGKKAFKQAESATSQLEKGVKKLAKQFVQVFAAQKVLAFSKASVKAFAADEKAAKSLAVALANTGNAFATLDVESFIAKLQRTTGVLDDELRPAFRTLLTATGDVKKSQEGLQLALDISAGTGKDLSAVSMALAKAYGGQTTALSRLGAGLDKATLKTGNMDVILGQLNDKFGGQALAAVKTYSGQIAVLNVALQNAKETIGKGLLDSFAMLAGSNGLTDTVSGIQKMADFIADVTKNVAFMIKQFEALKPVLAVIAAAILVAFAPVTAAILAIVGLVAIAGKNLKKSSFAKGVIPGGMGNISMTGGSNQNIVQSQAANSAASKLLATEKARLANLKKITAEQQKKTALDKLSSVLTQAQKIFDMERIELAAAAMNKQTEEDRVRIRLKTEILDLEEAINSGNVEGATRLASAIVNDAKLLGDLRGAMISLGDVPNPFAAWLATLQAALAALLALTTVVQPTSGGTMYGITYSAGNSPSDFAASTGRSLQDSTSIANKIYQMEKGNSNLAFMAKGGIVNSATLAMIGEAGPEAVIPLDRMGSMGGTTVIVNVSGSVTTERDLVSAITQGIYNNQASGIPVNYTTAY